MIVSLLSPQAAKAKKWYVEVSYTEVAGCPGAISVDPLALEPHWHGMLGSTKVVWKESAAVAADQAEWTINWTPAKSSELEFSHLPPVIKIPADKDKSSAKSAIAAYAPDSKDKWFWTYEISVEKEGCAMATLDPAIIFRDGSGGSPFAPFLVGLLLLLTIGAGGYYFGMKFADR